MTGGGAMPPEGGAETPQWGDPRLRGLSPAGLVTWAEQWLEENPDAPVRERVAVGVVIACGGERHPEQPIQWSAVVEASDCADVAEAIQGLYSCLEEAELRQEQLGEADRVS